MNTVMTSLIGFAPRRLFVPIVLAILLVNLPIRSQAQDRPPERPEPPTLTVIGQGETFAAPDSATLRLGAIAEDKEAVSAQTKVNVVMQSAMKALRALGIPEKRLTTAGLSLTPVYEQQERQLNVTRPRIVGYRARNTVQIQLQDLQLVGKAIDAGVGAGANQIESLSFQLKDDGEARKKALTLAIEEARGKAETIASAMQVRLKGVREVIEGGVHIMQPRMEFAQARMAMAADTSTPVQAGEVRIEANVTVRYYLETPAPAGR